MHIRAGYRISYLCPQPVPMVLLLSLRPERLQDLVTRQLMTTSVEIPLRDFVDGFGNIATRLVAPAGQITFEADFIVEDSGELDPYVPDAVLHPIDALPDDVLVYLMGSRYCETNRLQDQAWRMFGHIANGWDRVQAIVDYAHERVEFGYHFARPTKTAFDAHEEQQGVCRDFAHLAITLCRCVNIPARYCTGYLGDIGVPPVDAPMDFSAWFQVYLGGAWHTFDARHNERRVGRLLMAIGRDATDTAITTTFGPNQLVEFTVITEEVEEKKQAVL